MKNSIVFKFIAILLCAASLLGAIGSIAGVIVLTEGDLYNKTVEQVKEERTKLYATDYATVLARMYASTELGGSPERMVIGDSFSMFEHEFSNYGYRILDAEGTVLSAYNEDLKDTASLYTFSPTGQYMHLVSVESQSEIDAREAQEQIASYTQNYGDNSSQVPPEGIVINDVILLDANGARVYEATSNGYDHINTSCYINGQSYGGYFEYTGEAGFLFYNTNGELVYQSFLKEEWATLLPETEVSEYCFVNYEEGFFLSASNPEGIGTIAITNNKLRFVSHFVQPAAVEAVQETIPEENPGWVLETHPDDDSIVTVIRPDGTSVEVTFPGEETQPEETEAVEETSVPLETTIAETVPDETVVEESVSSSASAVPENTEAAEFTEVTEAVEATQAAEAPTEPTVAETVPEETVPEVTEPILINGKTLDNFQVNQTEYYDYEANEHMIAEYVYLPMPELTVELYVDKDTMQDASMYELLELVRQYRSYQLPAIAVCLLLFAVLAVYLCTAAGRKPKTEEVRAGGLNRLPLDLYLCGAGFGIALCIVYGVEGMNYLVKQDLLTGCAVAVGLFFLASLLLVGFCFAFVAQMKTPGGFWWRNTICGRFLHLCMRFGRWLETFLATTGFPAMGRGLKKLWNFTVKSVIWLYHAFETGTLWLGDKLGKFFRWIGRKIGRFFSLIPLTWQWLVMGFFLIIVLLIGIDGFKDGNDMTLPIALILTMAVVVYVSHCFGVLLESTKKMAKGDLDTKVDDKLMIGCFKEFAGDLNNLAGVAVIAAQKQLKSERMKTELITNVSHDIKTPLTSIINYVDLLQKPHSEEEEQQYLEVLDRQSQRLKKLIDDLMDMSKANTGNMQVDITRVDAVESVNQALGEFADKLDKAQLIPVFRHNDAQIPMMADGKLVWRVLSNILSNAVKYAMPGTRLYIDLMALEGKVVLSLKNISREELNVDADELMERFVRGDDSRNTEGSGLGLNIAKSLMELQKGQLQLLVDGDLFKVTLIFPGA